MEPFFRLFRSRGENSLLIEQFIEDELPRHENLASNAGSEELYLMGTTNLTLLDI
jgi:hypothetical protein